MLAVYSLAKDGNTQITPHFKVKEFASHDGNDVVVIDTDLVKVLEKVRCAYGKSIKVNSGFRTYAHNKKVGGVANSCHMKGLAADIAMSGVSVKDLYEYMDNTIPDEYCIGLYSGFIHICKHGGYRKRFKGGY